MNKVLAPVFIVLFLFGCASADLLRQADTPEQKYWAALNVFDVYDQAGLEIAQDPNTPVYVKTNLKRIRNVAKQALVLADEAYHELMRAREQMEGNPEVTNLDLVNAALSVFNSRAELAFHKVDLFKDAIDAFQN